MTDKTKTAIEMSVPFDGFMIASYVGWLEANNHRPFATILTDFAGVVMPPHLKNNPLVVMNLSSMACTNMRWGDFELECSMRFNGTPAKIVLPYRAILAVGPSGAGPEHAIQLPWAADSHTATMTAVKERGTAKAVEQETREAVEDTKQAFKAEPAPSVASGSNVFDLAARRAAKQKA